MSSCYVFPRMCVHTWKDVQRLPEFFRTWMGEFLWTWCTVKRICLWRILPSTSIQFIVTMALKYMNFHALKERKETSSAWLLCFILRMERRRNSSVKASKCKAEKTRNRNQVNWTGNNSYSTMFTALVLTMTLWVRSKVSTWAKWLGHSARAYSSFHSMKQLREILPPLPPGWDASSSWGYLSAFHQASLTIRRCPVILLERGTGESKVFCTRALYDNLARLLYWERGAASL